MENRINIKWIFTLLMFCAFPFLASAWHGDNDIEIYPNMQIDKMERILDKYSQSKYIESVDISPTLLLKLSGAKNTDDLVKKISGLRIVILEKKDDDSRTVYNALISEVKNAVKVGYSRLMSINSDGNQITVYMAEANKQLVMLVDSDSEFSLVCIDGSITSDIIKAVMDGDIKIK